MNSIEYKYQYGEKVYYIDIQSIPTIDKCYMCLGDGYLKKSNDTKATCYICNGKGEITYGGSLKYVVKEGIINKVNIELDDCIGIYYKLKKEKGKYIEYKIFKTKEEAQTECDKENSKCIMGYSSI